MARPTFNTFKLMNRLGQRRVRRARAGPGDAGSWGQFGAGLEPGGGPAGQRHPRRQQRAQGDRRGDQAFHGAAQGARPGQAVKVSYVDMERGSPYPAWRALGSPQYPTRDQLAKIRAAASRRRRA
ncbi:hypothetical protein ACRAWD_27630 [Caulobacter segnis]